ncbi:MAG TPA: hypothetical protein VFE31_07120 [Opitutaceae bacterium]|nr:hypothetical protein [Opitutaceae bacterium]
MLVLGIVAGLQGARKITIKASRVIADPVPTGVAPAAGIAFERGKPAPKRGVGRIPAHYVAGRGTIVNGTEANQAILAALAAYPNGLINRVVKLSDGSYEVHHIGVAWPHHIFVGANFKYLGAD